VTCRHCQTPLRHAFIDLGDQPASNAYLSAAEIGRVEAVAPLKTFVCDQCWLVQLPSHHSADQLFTSDYAYFSSVSSTWVEHARRYVSAMRERLGLDGSSFVVELASNDGYLLQFVKAAGIPCLGIEPTASTAAASRALGIETLEVFFGEEVARGLVASHRKADLIAANNVFAHVPDINDFAAGFRELLAPEGVATLEFPHLMQLVDGGQFDTIYHEHYSYISLDAARRIFERQGMRIFDVEELSTHGGSLRIYVCHRAATAHTETAAVGALLARETRAGLQTLAYYSDLQRRAERVRADLRAFLVEQKRMGLSVAAYGAAAKGNTLLNFARVSAEDIAFVCDAAPSKIGRYLPGTHIPILSPDALRERRPDFVVILPWNIKDEIIAKHGYIAEWGGRFVLAQPTLDVIG
jgi:SAM-dependent methyltransferase